MTPGVGLAAAAVIGLAMTFALRGSDVLSLTAAALAATLLLAMAALGESLPPSAVRGPGLALLAGLLASATLVCGADRSVLAWRFASGGAEIPGVGLVLGVMLLVVLGGTLLGGADRLCPGASRFAGVVGARALMLAAALGAIGTALILKAAFFDEAVLVPLAGVSGAVAAGTWLLGIAAVGPAKDAADEPALQGSRVALLSSLAAAAGVLALLAAGYESWVARGHALAGATPHVLAAALAGIAAAQPTRFTPGRLLIFLGGLIGALAVLL